MISNQDIWVLTADLGYKLLDRIRDDFPERFVNCGASEQAMLDIACGLAMSGKIPFVYTITPFLLYRPFETLRTYIDHEKLNVKLIGAGRDKEYGADGFTHWAEEDWKVMEALPNIRCYWPDTNEEAKTFCGLCVYNKGAYYINLKR